MIKHFTFKLRNKENNEIIACVNCPLEVCYQSLKKAEWLKQFEYFLYISDYTLFDNKYTLGDEEKFLTSSTVFNSCESYKDFIVAIGYVLEEIGYDS